MGELPCFQNSLQPFQFCFDPGLFTCDLLLLFFGILPLLKTFSQRLKQGFNPTIWDFLNTNSFQALHNFFLLLGITGANSFKFFRFNGKDGFCSLNFALGFTNFPGNNRKFALSSPFCCFQLTDISLQFLSLGNQLSQAGDFFLIFIGIGNVSFCIRMFRGST